MKILKILSVLLVIVSLIFIFQNLENATVKFIKYSFTAPIALIVAIALFAGFFVGTFFIWPELASKRRTIKIVEKENIFLKKKLDESAIKYNTEGLGLEGENNM